VGAAVACPNTTPPAVGAGAFVEAEAAVGARPGGVGEATIIIGGTVGWLAPGTGRLHAASSIAAAGIKKSNLWKERIRGSFIFQHQSIYAIYAVVLRYHTMLRAFSAIWRRIGIAPQRLVDAAVANETTKPGPNSAAAASKASAPLQSHAPRQSSARPILALRSLRRLHRPRSCPKLAQHCSYVVAGEPVC
jgi:hypothetical protein